MEHKDIQEIAIIYGKKDWIMEFLEIFEMDRMHDGAPLSAVLLKGDMKQYSKQYICEGAKLKIKKRKKKAFNVASKFIYDSLMDVDRKYKCQEAVNFLYDEY